MKVKKIVIDATVIAEHLTTSNKESILRKLSKEYFCYTTVFSAIELFAAAKSLKEKQAVDDAMNALKVLGINGKSAKNIGAIVSSSTVEYRVLIAGICIESRLPLVTLNPKRFAGIKKLDVIKVTKLIQ